MKKNALLLTTFGIGLMFMFACNNQKTETTETIEQEEVAEATEQSKTYTIDKENSKLTWFAEKVTGKHDGTVNIQSGEIAIEDGNITAGNFVIDMNTITVLDIEDEKMNAKLTNHLMDDDDDFFATRVHPTAKFEITSVEEVEKEGITHHVKGNLTIKEITNPVEIPVNVTIKDNMLNAKGNVVLDRTKWDITYNSANFFENIGDKAIYDEFKIGMDILAEAK